MRTLTKKMKQEAVGGILRFFIIVLREDFCTLHTRSFISKVTFFGCVWAGDSLKQKDDIPLIDFSLHSHGKFHVMISWALKKKKYQLGGSTINLSFGILAIPYTVGQISISFLLYAFCPPPELPLWAMGTLYVIAINLSQRSLFLYDSWYCT